MKIEMVDLKSQYLRLKSEIDSAMQECIDSSQFIGGDIVADFEDALARYLGTNEVISCANGTDALQLALMALELSENDEVIVPSFNYVASAEVICLLGLKPVFVDVEPDYFSLDVHKLEEKITPKTKAIISVHLFGQCGDLKLISSVCKENNIYHIEDNAQSLGSRFDGKYATGTIGHIGCTSFFPSKILGCYGDGGATITHNGELAYKMRLLARHGQSRKYQHELIGMNSRLDAIQANILRIKLKEIEDFISRRRSVADEYDKRLRNIAEIQIPKRNPNVDHVFHQYTIRVKGGKRDALKFFLTESDVPSMIYYPKPLHAQKAFEQYYDGNPLPVTEMLCEEVLSLPIHTEMNAEQIDYICDQILRYFK